MDWFLIVTFFEWPRRGVPFELKVVTWIGILILQIAPEYLLLPLHPYQHGPQELSFLEGTPFGMAG